MWDNILRRLFLLPFVTRAATDTYDCCQEVQLTGETIKYVPNKIADFVSQYLLIFSILKKQRKAMDFPPRNIFLFRLNTAPTSNLNAGHKKVFI